MIDRVPSRLVAPLSKRIWEVICSWREFFLTGFHHQAQKTVFLFFLVLYARSKLLDFSWNPRIQMWHLQETCYAVLHFESKSSSGDFIKSFALKYKHKLSTRHENKCHIIFCNMTKCLNFHYVSAFQLTQLITFCFKAILSYNHHQGCLHILASLCSAVKVCHKDISY